MNVAFLQGDAQGEAVAELAIGLIRLHVQQLELDAHGSTPGSGGADARDTYLERAAAGAVNAQPGRSITAARPEASSTPS